MFREQSLRFKIIFSVVSYILVIGISGNVFLYLYLMEAVSQKGERLDRACLEAARFRIMTAKRPGSIIPIRLGLLPGGRPDYLYNSLGVLFDALINAGYRVLPVSTVIERSGIPQAGADAAGRF